LITPTAKSSVRLDELNSILDEMEKGEEAVKRLSDIDKDAGFTGKKKVREGREVGMPPNNQNLSRTNIDVDSTASAAAYLKGVLTDDDLAADRLKQAEAMQKQAEQLLAEAKRLTEEAKSLTPAKNAKPTRAKKAATAKKQAA
jgi:predicted ribosome quality control (RQC) complex YloA/Tae2 family protein